jgi:hypothetical protein
MIDVSTYWTLPRSHQGPIRDEVKQYEQDLLIIAGYYYIDDFLSGGEYIYFTLLCSGCYNTARLRGDIDVGYTPLTKGQYLDPNHDMHGETCEKCNKSLA